MKRGGKRIRREYCGHRQLVMLFAVSLLLASGFVTSVAVEGQTFYVFYVKVNIGDWVEYNIQELSGFTFNWKAGDKVRFVVIYKDALEIGNLDGIDTVEEAIVDAYLNGTLMQSGKITDLFGAPVFMSTGDVFWKLYRAANPRLQVVVGDSNVTVTGSAPGGNALMRAVYDWRTGIMTNFSLTGNGPNTGFSEKIVLSCRGALPSSPLGFILVAGIAATVSLVTMILVTEKRKTQALLI